jgi:CBS domain containing-hemolysin-like protein
MLLSELLPLMQQSRQPMVMVVDEFGGTAGLITIENIVAEILGETIEPDPSDVPPMQQIDEQTYLVQAQLNLEEVNEALNSDLPITDDYQTLAGFLLYELQRIPSQGETLRFAGYEFTVMAIDGPRIDQIQIRQLELPTLEEASTQGDLDSEADVASRDRTAEATASEKPSVEQHQPSNNGSSTNSDHP